MLQPNPTMRINPNWNQIIDNKHKNMDRYRNKMRLVEANTNYCATRTWKILQNSLKLLEIGLVEITWIDQLQHHKDVTRLDSNVTYRRYIKKEYSSEPIPLRIR